jgi:uncharacterized protein YhfF
MSGWHSLKSFSFGDTPELADKLAALVLAGTKTATCCPVSAGIDTEVGQRWVVRDGAGRPVAVIETTELVQRRFDEVDAQFAYDEGEGDRSLTYWRDAHRRYFTRRGEFTDDMLLYCERFKLIERLADG